MSEKNTYTCKCGAIILLSSRSKHLQSKKHLYYERNQIVIEEMDERETILREALNKANVELRDDSRLCRIYIEKGDNYPGITLEYG